MARPIVFLSDFGYDDEFVGLCHGVITKIAPNCSVIDLTHGIAPHSVRRAAIVLARCVQFMPTGAVYLAVVDPGVGTERLAVAVATGSGAFLVGPDNGILSLAWEELGGASAAAVIASDAIVLRPTSATFHGRDVFSPAAATLAAGGELDELGSAIDPAKLERVKVPQPKVASGYVGAEILGADRFGNLELAMTARHLAEAGLDSTTLFTVEVAGSGASDRVAVRAETFGDVPEGGLGVIVDSWGLVSVAGSRESAAMVLGASEGDALLLRARPTA